MSENEKTQEPSTVGSAMSERLDPAHYFAWIMFETHTFRKTDCGTREQVFAVVDATSREAYPAEDREFALYSLHHAALKDPNGDHTKIYTGRDPRKILGGA